jgi:hypothetical protein
LTYTEQHCLVFICAFRVWNLPRSISAGRPDFFLHGKGPRSRCYGCTTALRLFVQPYDEDEDEQVLQVMEHQWNEIDRGKIGPVLTCNIFRITVISWEALRPKVSPQQTYLKAYPTLRY